MLVIGVLVVFLSIFTMMNTNNRMMRPSSMYYR
jgi:hypothetical protein